jgi:class 3 adenylate cyclase
MKLRTPNLAWLGGGLAIAFWLLESLLHTLVFNSGPLNVTLLGENDPNELWMRIFISAMFVAFGWIAERAVHTERRQKESALRLNHLLRFLDHVMQRVRHRTTHKHPPLLPLQAQAGALTGDSETLRIEELALNNEDVGLLSRFLQELSSFVDTRFKELHAVLELMHEINRKMLFDEVLDKAYETLHLVLPYDRLSVALLDDDCKTVRAHWARSENPDLTLQVGYSAPLNDTSLRDILLSGEPRIINDLAAYFEKHPDSATTRMLLAEGIRASLTCPLNVTGKSIGFMFFSSCMPDTYKNAHIEIFKLIAGHLSVVLEKSTLYQQILAEKEKSDRFLLNVVPARIAARLRAGEAPVVENFSAINILFADIVAFTEFASRFPPETVVDFLQNIFVRMDQLCDKFGVEKIKTIGDEYMVISGLNDLPSDKPTQNLAEFALAVIELAAELKYPDGRPVQIRIGMHSGSAVAGVIGQKKFAYDIWGDAVNIASRMESNSEAGRIHVTQEIYSRLSSTFLFEERGASEIKGKGQMTTYFLTAKQ